MHYFLYWAKDASESRFALELERNGADFQLFSDYINFNYKRRFRLYLVAWPQLLISTIRRGVQSLLARPRPDVVVLSSHIELAVLVVLRKLLRRRNVRLMLSMFIYTRGGSQCKERLKYWYLHVVLSQASRIVCHSAVEALRYSSLFRLPHTRFVFVPYATNVAEAGQNSTPPPRPYVLSAGRSGRDYGLLMQVFKDLPYELHIVCDSHEAIGTAVRSANVRVLRSCYGQCYYREIRNCSLVVVPLDKCEISAGQMVMLHAMYYSKPIIITRTATTVEYVRHGETAWFVEQGDLHGLRAAVEHLMSNAAAAARLGEQGRRLYEQTYSMAAYVVNLQRMINGLDNDD